MCSVYVRACLLFTHQADVSWTTWMNVFNSVHTCTGSTRLVAGICVGQAKINLMLIAYAWDTILLDHIVHQLMLPCFLMYALKNWGYIPSTLCASCAVSNSVLWVHVPYPIQTLAGSAVSSYTLKHFCNWKRIWRSQNRCMYYIASLAVYAYNRQVKVRQYFIHAYNIHVRMTILYRTTKFNPPIFLFALIPDNPPNFSAISVPFKSLMHAA